MPYDVDKDPYLDKETGVLRNLLGLKTNEQLDDAEAELTTVVITALTTEEAPDNEEFNANLLKLVHWRLFKEIYDWAGKLRTVELSKGTTLFAQSQYLYVNLDDLFIQLARDDYLMTINRGRFVSMLAHYYGELIVLHPFREGNGRTIRTFLAMLAESIGWHVAWDEMNPKENIDASIAAYRGDELPLKKMLGRIVTPVEAFWGRDPYEFI